MAPMKMHSRRHPAETFTITHLAHRWGVPRKTIRRLMKSGQLPFEQIAGQLRVPVASVQQLERDSPPLGESKLPIRGERPD
jgi:excisionase family DNA binding protein